MKKISLFILALSFFTACKNDPSAASAATDTTPSTTVAPAPDLEAGKAAAMVQYKMLNDLITDIDAMPADFRNKPEVVAIRNEMGDISGKATRMMTYIQPEATAEKTVKSDRELNDAPDVADVISSMQRYGEIITADRAKFDALAGSYKK